MARIVVAEDDPDIHLLIRFLLEDRGHRVTMASTGEAALAAVTTEGVILVILDIAMPGDLDGLDVTRMLRAEPDHGRRRSCCSALAPARRTWRRVWPPAPTTTWSSRSTPGP